MVLENLLGLINGHIYIIRIFDDVPFIEESSVLYTGNISDVPDSLKGSVVSAIHSTYCSDGSIGLVICLE